MPGDEHDARRGDVQCEPEQGREQQHGREGREIERFRRLQRDHQDQQADHDVGDEADVEDQRRNRDGAEEHTYELQSLMRTSYAVFCLKKNTALINMTLYSRAEAHRTVNESSALSLNYSQISRNLTRQCNKYKTHST